MEHHSAIKNEFLPSATMWMHQKGIKLSEIIQRKTDAIRFHLHVESKKQMNKQNRNSLIGTQNISKVAGGRGFEGMSKNGEGIWKYKLIVSE